MWTTSHRSAAASSADLDNISVASPCTQDWARMRPGEENPDQVRFCSSCSKNVYDISAMTKTEAEELISSREGRLCVRYFRRHDGTILTKDCPVGLAAIRQRWHRLISCASTVLLSLFGLQPAQANDGIMQGEMVMPTPKQQPAVKTGTPANAGGGYEVGRLPAYRPSDHEKDKPLANSDKAGKLKCSVYLEEILPESTATTVPDTQHGVRFTSVRVGVDRATKTPSLESAQWRTWAQKSCATIRGHWTNLKNQPHGKQTATLSIDKNGKLSVLHLDAFENGKPNAAATLAEGQTFETSINAAVRRAAQNPGALKYPQGKLPVQDVRLEIEFTN